MNVSSITGTLTFSAFIFAVLCCGGVPSQFCYANDGTKPQYYKAAVYERLDPTSLTESLEETMLKSLALYEQQASYASSLGVHILVFPEYGVTGSLPPTRQGQRPYLQVLPSIEPAPWNPCLQPDPSPALNTTVLRRLSCAARTHRIVIVANFATLVACDPSDDPSCPSDDEYHFNSDVAFGEDGTVLAVYHKIHLYHEPMDKGPYPPGHVITFQTEAATFGLLTCFDILFYEPTVSLVRDHGVQNLVMTTFWMDGLPFLTSVQFQMALAAGLDVNVMAANIQKNIAGARGSGIYTAQHGYLNYTYGPLSSGRLVTADVPTLPTSPETSTAATISGEMFPYTGIVYDDVSNYTLVPLNASQEGNARGNVQLQHGTLRCSVDYAFQRRVDAGDYFFAAYQGHIYLGSGTYRLAVEVCALLWCRNGDARHCAVPPVTSTTDLLHLDLEGNFSTPYVYPSVLQHDLFLVSRSEWSYEVEQSNEIGEFDTESAFSGGNSGPLLQKTHARLLTGPEFRQRPLVASLYGRVYPLD